MIKEAERKRKLLQKGVAMLTAAALLTGICAAPETAQAKEQAVVSHGSLVYEDDRGGAKWYAEDLLLIRDKLSDIPQQCYDPSCYTHDHSWVYPDRNDKTHTRHCDGCGSAFDSISTHTAVLEEPCAISHGEKTYPGRKYTCECGWQWTREAGHTPVFEPVDAVSHKSRCALDGTAFCLGYEPITEEHYAYYYVPGEDGAHHEKICLDCGYREEETCSFILESPDPEGGEPETLLRCVCGNSVKQEETSETSEAPDAPAEEETPEPPDVPDAPAEEETPELPDAPTEEETPELPDAPAEEETSNAPDVPGAPVEEETSDAPDAPAEESFIQCSTEAAHKNRTDSNTTIQGGKER